MISAGISLLILATGILIIKGSWSKYYALLLMAVTLIYQILLPPQGEYLLELVGFQLNLYQYSPLSKLVGIFFAFFGLAVYLALWSSKYLPSFYFLSLVHIGSAMAILLVGDLLSFFVLWEVITLSAIGLLLTHNHQVGRQLKTYFIYQILGAVFLLTGIGLNYQATQSIAISSIQQGQLFFLLAILVKGGVFPFQTWVTATYPKMAPGLTLLFSGYTTKVGLFSIWLLLPGLDLQLFGASIACIFVLIAIKQHQFRQLLAYHLLSQMGYILAVMGGIGTSGSLAGSYHLINNILYKGLLFMIAGMMIGLFGHDDLIKLRGRVRSQPYLFLILVIASASIVGLPPFNGFVSKLLIKKSVQHLWAGRLLTLASIGTGLSFTKVLYYGCLTSKGEKWPALPPEKRLLGNQKLALGLLAFACILLGLFPEVLNNLVTDLSIKTFSYSWPYIWKGIWPVLIAIGLFITVYKQINHAIVRIIEKMESVLEPTSAMINRSMERAIHQLVAAHSGNLQHYLIWICTALTLLWAYILLA